MIPICVSIAESVEPGLKPNQPKAQNERAENGQGNIMARNGVGGAIGIILADAGPEHLGTDKGDGATGNVHHRRSGEVDVTVTQTPVVAHGREPAATPNPVAKDGIEKGAYAETVNDKRNELPALRARSGRDDAVVSMNTIWKRKRVKIPGSKALPRRR